MASHALRILVAGDADGEFKALFQRVSKVNKASGPYDMLLCVGEFFGSDAKQWEDMKSGKVKVEVPTYILGPVHAEMKSFYPDIKGCELAKNLVYLGDAGVFTGASGMKIAYMSGLENNPYGGLSLAYDSIKSIEVQLGGEAGFKGVDILLTSQWPKSVTSFAAVPPGFDPVSRGSALVSRLALKVKPRYHFAGREGIFYQRLPYRNHRVLAESQRHVTRFIGLGKVGNKEQKWLYAFQLTPMPKLESAALLEQPYDTTESPYVNDPAIANVGLPTKPEASQFFYDTSYNPNENGRDNRKRKREDNKPTGPPAPCWFCLSSPDVGKHLIISIGEHVYLALAKGFLVPNHCLILPIGHVQSERALPEEALEEVRKFQDALKKCFAKEDKVLVYFERSFKSPHMQIQCCPVPKNVESRLQEAFMDSAEEQDIQVEKIPKNAEIDQILKPGQPYFHLELPSGDRYLAKIQKTFPLQFGRDVLSSRSVLNVADRTDWRNCKDSQEEEAEIAKRFRKKFEPFDFTL